ncbi:putative uncharacterized protein DDB_G0282133 isoform X2 [Pseudomyrmex gracilis]|nr:putative uncharacterized protein DDB_G0282133 isoform X2 [Pseudomyrmex gracilis]
MQTWNQWQVSSDAVTTPGSQPAGYVAASATDPMAMMQTHLQYYNQPAPSGYTPEQWTRKIQQEWVQWQQWQQQYQQWQAQYGEKYQQTMHHLSMQNLNLTNQAQLLSNIQPPLLPQENTAPPLSLTAKNTYQFINMPPPHQNNLPLFPAKEPTNTTTQTNATNHPQNPPLPTYQPINQPPLPPDSGENKQNVSIESCESNVISEYNSAKNRILEDNEKTEAEKTFDAQFKQWEEQFNKWKEQNADHPDKAQYKQYEAKWTAWREKLIERREQMRKKREQQKQVTTKTEVEKTKTIAGDNKIMDILSNTENQGLINNLLGIGKTLGLTGKQDVNVPLPPPPPPPPPPPENTSSNQHLVTQAQQTPQMNMTKPTVASSWSNQQQWPSQQHNPRMNVPRHGPELPGTDTISTTQANIGLSQIISPNFTQPPPNIAQNCPQFSSNFSNNDRSQLQTERTSANERNGPAYDLSDPSNMNMRFMHSNDRSAPNFNRLSSFRRNDQEHLEQDNINLNLNEREDQLRSTDNFDRAESHRFRGDDRNYNDFGNIQSNRSNNFNPNNERFGLGNDRFGQNNDHFVKENNRFTPMENDKFGDRFRSCNDRFGPGSDRFNNERFRPSVENDRFKPEIDRFTMDKDRHGPGNNRFGPPFGSDRFPLSSERFVTAPGFDRFSSSNNRFGPNNEHLRPNDRFGRGNVDYFNSKDGPDLRSRDSFDINFRGGFNRNLPFSPLNELPELKKLMEKRKAAGDVFKPSFVDSEKCSNVDSLSESFKKIAGGSLFKNSFDLQKNRNDESAILLNKASNFEQHCHSEIEQSPTSLYGPRSHPFNRNEPLFREFSDTFVKSNSMNYNDRLDKNMEIKSHHIQSQTTNVQSQDSIKHSDDNKVAGSSLETNNSVVDTVDTVIELNETNNTTMQTDVVTSKDISEENKNKECQINDNDTSLERNDNEYNNQISSVEIIKEVDNKDNASKQSESLPFMDETDPPPEDLNIEPPPELPNLSPVSTNLSQNALSSNNNCSENKLIGNQFNLRFDAREIEVKSGFASREPPTFNSFGPSEPHALPMDPVFQPRNSLDKDLGLQVFNKNQLESNENSFSSGRPNTEQYNKRNCNNQESFADSNNRQFDRRGFMDEQFGQYGSRNLGPNGPKCFDRQIESKNQIDVTFATSKSSLFELKDNDMQCNSKTDNSRMDFRSPGFSENYFGSRGPNDAFSGPRRLDDTPSDFRGLSNPQCGPTEFNRFSNTNEAPFEKKLPFDKSGFSFSNENSLGSRNYVKGLPDSCSPNNTILNSHNLNDILQRNLNNSKENQFQSRNLNNRPFRPLDLKEKDLMNDSNNPYFSPLEDSSLFFNRCDYARRDSYVRKGQFEDDISTKRIRYKSPNEFNKTFSDRNISMEMQKDYSSDTKNVSDKTGLEKISHQEYRPTDVWKDKFGNDQITDRGQHDIDYKSRRGESVPELDFQSTRTFDVFKRPQLKTGKEFCAPKQFNYNHGEVNKKFTESHHFTPVKVIDYEHKSRPLIVDQHLTSVQSFDYGHGNLKPVTLNREQQKQHYYSKTDFRNWVESEQNLKEYTDAINNLKSYKNKTNNYDAHKSLDCNKRKKQDWQLSDKKFDEERRENNRKERECNPESESSYIDLDSDNDQNNRYQSDTNVLKGQAQEICESSKEMNKDNNKDDIRLKGNISCQENSNKNVVDTKIQEISISSDTKKNVAELSPQTLDLSRLPNNTMVDDLLCPPGRQNRPPKIAIILRGPPGSGKSFVAKLIKDKEVEQGGSAPRILSLDDYFLVEKEIETTDDNGKKVKVKEMVYEYEEAMEQSYVASLCKAFKKNIIDGFFTFIILDCINEKISDYEDMWSFAKTKGFKVYVCEMEMDPQICLKRNIHNRTEDEINRIIDYFEPTPSYHQKLDVNSMLQEQAIEEVDMEDSQGIQKNSVTHHEDSQDSQQDISDESGVSKWERMEAEDKLDRLDGLAKKKNETKPQTMEDFLQVPDYYDMEDTSGKKRVRWADLEERKKQEKMRAVGFVVGHTNWDRMMDPTKGGSALTRTK